MTTVMTLATLAAPTGGQDVARLFDLVLDRLNSPSSKMMYRRALLDFLAWYRAQPADTFDKATVQRYRATLLLVRSCAPSGLWPARRPTTAFSTPISPPAWPKSRASPRPARALATG